jgi:pSer/pThr/pTyr-binding forkhead associated (FHA) protein
MPKGLVGRRAPRRRDDQPNGAFIEDLRSVNGVTVNGQRIRHARVTDGDVIELGVKRFRFTSSAPGRNAL